MLKLQDSLTGVATAAHPHGNRTSAGWVDQRDRRSSEPNFGEAGSVRTHFSFLAEVASLQPTSSRGMRGRKNETISRLRGSLCDGLPEGDDDKEADGAILNG